MSVLGKFIKQPSEVMDYDITYEAFFAYRSDSISAFSAVAEAGMTVERTELDGKVAKVVLSGGVAGVKYKVTVTMTTTSQIVKEDEFYVTVKEY